MRIINSLAPQKGVTLITILIVLLLVTAIGALAIKQAITSLRISTNSQVRQLLMQSADLPLYVIRNTDPTVLRKLDNVIGLAINNNFPDREYIFCYRPTVQKNLAPINKVAEISALTTTGNVTTLDEMRLISGGRDSFCDLTKDFGSARTGVITQVAVSSYRQYILRSYASTAEVEMQRLAQDLERCKSRNFSYRAYTPTTINVGNPLKYTVTLQASSTKSLVDDGTDWVMRAVPVDDSNYTYLLNSQGLKCRNKAVAIVTLIDCGGESNGSESW